MWPTDMWRMSWEMFTISQAIQQSHFFRAERNWATRIRMVTQASRYGTGSEGNLPGNTALPMRLMNQPHTPARMKMEVMAMMRCRHPSIVTFNAELSSELCSPDFG